MEQPEIPLDHVIHQPIRTRIIAYLVSRGPTDDATLRSGLALSDGLVTKHIRELIDSEYVSFEKGLVNGKYPRTTYRMSPLGRRRFGDYLSALLEIIHGE